MLLLALLVSLAHAQDTDDEAARAHHEAGRVYLERGRFDEAAREFEEAYALSPRPEILYNLSVAYRDAGRLREAAGALRRYLETDPDDENRAMLEERLRRLEADARAREQQPAPESSGPSGLVIAGASIAGAGVAALGVSIVTSILAAGETSALDDLCDDAHSCMPGYEEPLESARDLATVSNVLYAVGGGLVAVGAVLFVLGIMNDDDMEVALGPTGASIAGRFP